MTKIFISYRREDSRKDAGRIYDRLAEAFGKEHVFKDVDSIPAGADFRAVLANAVKGSDIFLAVIGSRWLSSMDDNGNRRLDNPADFVRIEVQMALTAENCRVIPVLVDNASMPHPDELPDDLQELAFKNAVVVRDDPDFHPDVSKLLKELPQSDAPSPSQAKPTFSVTDAISQFFAAFDARDWDVTRQKLTEIRTSGRAPSVFDVDYYEKKVWAEIAQKEAETDYDILRLMARRGDWQGLGTAFPNFAKAHPGYDPDDIAGKLAAWVRPPAVIRPTNLNFAGPTAEGQPVGWFDSLGFVNGVSTDYEASVVPRQDRPHSVCLRFQNLKATEDQFGSFMQRCPAHFVAGRKLRLEGEISTRDIAQWAGLWFRVDGDKEYNLFFDNMSERPIRGTTPWTSYVIDADITQKPAWLNYGIVLVGKGTMWAANFRLLVWESDKWHEV